MVCLCLGGPLRTELRNTDLRCPWFVSVDAIILSRMSPTLDHLLPGTDSKSYLLPTHTLQESEVRSEKGRFRSHSATIQYRIIKRLVTQRNHTWRYG